MSLWHVGGDAFPTFVLFFFQRRENESENDEQTEAGGGKYIYICVRVCIWTTALFSSVCTRLKKKKRFQIEILDLTNRCVVFN